MSQDIFLPKPSDLDQRTEFLRRSLRERILVLDGATGTAMQAFDLDAEDYGGEDFEGCHENLNRTRPDVVRSVHRRYLEAGADIVETNSFGGTPLVLAEYGLEKDAFELNRLSAQCAREACLEFDTPDRLRFVCGSLGPTTKAISVTGGVSFEDLIDHFRVQALGLMAGGADYLLLETSQDTRNIKAGLLGIEKAATEVGWRLPVAISVTIETTGTMLAGQDAEALAVSVAHHDLLYVGLNCATGPAAMRDSIRTLAELLRVPVACVPNAGLPDEDGLYGESPEDLAGILRDYADKGWLNFVGGCCGTTEAHITALAEAMKGIAPRVPKAGNRSFVSGLEAVELEEQNRPILVGERTNVLGSRAFRRLVEAGQWESAAEVGRRQVRGGAQILDVCLQDPDRDEMEDMDSLLEVMTRLVRAPLMIDTTTPDVMDRALQWCQGKAILNSVNLEDGRPRFDEVVALARQYGAAIVVGLIDEEGMAVSRERKMAVAERSYGILVESGIRPEDIWWDPLVFPCGTGDENYLGAGLETLESITLLKSRFPLTKTILGVSNVSFGLPTAGREILNSVFLYRATRAGLDAAIVNSEKLARYAEIAEEDLALSAGLLNLEVGVNPALSEEAVAAFAEHFRGRRLEVAPRESLPLPERLARAVVEGTKEGLAGDLAEALEDSRWATPLEIINGPLMEGMSEVGRLFNSNQLIVAEVLQSAEVMKAAVSYLKPHMEGAEDHRKGKVLLATVKGDVHDIGKNLVDIILSNNGFEVINLGIKVGSDRIIQAVAEHRPDVLGLSGLLVKSAHQMVLTAGDLKAVGFDVPLIVGGAALTRKFTHQRIAGSYGGFCTYAQDAMHGLDLINRLLTPDQKPLLEEEIEKRVQQDQKEKKQKKPVKKVEPRQRAILDHPSIAPMPADLDRHEEEFDLDEVWRYLNPQMLFGKHLGLRGSVSRLRDSGDPKLEVLVRLVEGLKEWGREGEMKVRGVWQFYKASTEGNQLRLESTQGEKFSWLFPRQDRDQGLCLTDYVLPVKDHVALFVVSAGEGVRSRAETFKEEGEFLKSHAWAALALETAEAAAEYLHRRLRAVWGFADAEDLSPEDVLRSRYRGKRYSFGYPACPDLDGQEPLFKALKPETIGVQLTEGGMMDPEASVSALVFHHPEARYFSAS